MKKVTLIALEKSIEHWERIATFKTRKNELPNAADCHLCKQFLDNGKERFCTTSTGEKCPIHLKTGETSCYKTPYNAAYYEFWNSKGDARPEARRMVDFLKSLRPTDV